MLRHNSTQIRLSAFYNFGNFDINIEELSHLESKTVFNYVTRV